MPWDLAVSATWRHYGAVDVPQSSDQPALSGSFAEINKEFDAKNYIDISATYFLGGTPFTLGINNLFDSDPPLSSIVGTSPGNGNTYPQVYDSFGRYIFLRTTLTFDI